MNFLNLKNVNKTHYSEAGNVVALDKVSFELGEDEFVVVIGPSGAGKTTLLNILGGMDSVTSGDVVLDGKNVSKFNKKELTNLRRFDIGFIFQFYNLMPNLTALENVELATEITPKSLDPEKCLEMVGLKNRVDHFPPQLSGGEQQRVSIARAIAKNPKLLLCDEPTGALDYKTGKKILKLLYEVGKNQHKLVIVVTHNQAITQMADRIIEIKNGTIVSNNINNNKKDIEDIEW